MWEHTHAHICARIPTHMLVPLNKLPVWTQLLYTNLLHSLLCLDPVNYLVDPTESIPSKTLGVPFLEMCRSYNLLSTWNRSSAQKPRGGRIPETSSALRFAIQSGSPNFTRSWQKKPMGTFRIRQGTEITLGVEIQGCLRCKQSVIPALSCETLSPEHCIELCMELSWVLCCKANSTLDSGSQVLAIKQIPSIQYWWVMIFGFTEKAKL